MFGKGMTLETALERAHKAQEAANRARVKAGWAENLYRRVRARAKEEGLAYQWRRWRRKRKEQGRTVLRSLLDLLLKGLSKGARLLGAFGWFLLTTNPFRSAQIIFWETMVFLVARPIGYMLAILLWPFVVGKNLIAAAKEPARVLESVLEGALDDEDFNPDVHLGAADDLGFISRSVELEATRTVMKTTKRQAKAAARKAAKAHALAAKLQEAQ